MIISFIYIYIHTQTLPIIPKYVPEYVYPINNLYRYPQPKPQRNLQVALIQVIHLNCINCIYKGKKSFQIKYTFESIKKKPI